jgi:peptidoglycan-N-acetylglucosamine deacetylase
MEFLFAAATGFSLFALNEIANPRFAFLGKVYWKGAPRGVALTFDDGPHPQYTPQILKILDRFQAQATFFVIGRHMNDHGRLISEASRAGHGIGNHSFSHDRLMSFSSAAKIRREVLLGQEEAERWVGYRPRFYRQPAGFRNPRIFGILKELDMNLAGWQVRAFDTQVKDPEVIVRRILAKVKPGGVILLHDGGDSPANDDRRATVAALPKILQGIKDRGFEFLTLEELFGVSKENPKI